MLRFDSDPTAILEPSHLVARVEGFPSAGVTTFSREMIEGFAAGQTLPQIAELRGANGTLPVYRAEHRGTPVAVYMSWAGAPACVAGFEEAVAMGLERLVMFGSCGVLDREIADGRLILPTAALRDEGTSRHYAPESEEIAADPQGLAAMEAALAGLGYGYVKGKTWTTDGIYRETRAKAARRRRQGCVAVEMECAAMLAAARFRRVRLAQFLYAADSLDGPEWEPRGLAEHGMGGMNRYMNAALECAAAL